MEKSSAMGSRAADAKGQHKRLDVFVRQDGWMLGNACMKSP